LADKTFYADVTVLMLVCWIAYTLKSWVMSVYTVFMAVHSNFCPEIWKVTFVQKCLIARSGNESRRLTCIVEICERWMFGERKVWQTSDLELLPTVVMGWRNLMLAGGL